MWIAKPVSALSAEEIDAWVTSQDLMRARGRDVPLAQTLTWAHAIRAMNLPAYLILGTDEGVGGIVHADPVRSASDGKLHLECVNGPLLEWGSNLALSRQLATFVMACSKLSRNFGSVSLHPRWRAEELDDNLDRIPIDPAEIHRAETLKLNVAEDSEKQKATFCARLRRTLSVTERGGATCSWSAWDPSRLATFEAGLKEFGAQAGFFVPPVSWFEALVLKNPFAEREGITFHHVESKLERQGRVEARTSLLVAVDRGGAHYLQGYDVRARNARSAFSTSALAHRFALDELRRRDVAQYDLNGFSDPALEDHPYAGVARFKAQFGGERVAFVSPEFRIEADPV